MKIERIAFVGLGALGVLYGGYLTEKLGREAVGFVADEGRRARYASRRITSNGRPLDFRLIPAEEKGEAADLVVFAVKAPALEQAMEDAAGQIDGHTVILSLLNGISSEGLLEARFGAKNVVYSVAQGMDAVMQGDALVYTKAGHICVGAPTAEKLPALDAVCELFERTGMPYRREEDILHRIWGKFMLNVGVNQVVMVYEGGYGTIQVSGEPREKMIAAMREVIALANCEGVRLTEDDLNEYLDLLAPLWPEGMPSMRQDGLAKRKSEVELFAGTVRRMAKKHNLAVPVNDWLYETVKRMEAEY